MATVALAILGGSIGASIGTAILGAGIGATVGSAVGQAIGASIGFQIDAQIFGLTDPTTGQGQRLEEITLSSGQPGTPMYEAWGRNARVPGHFIYLGDIVETTRTSKIGDGGKGGSDAYLTEYLYDIDAGIAIANADHRKVFKAHTVIMNGKKVIEEPLTSGEATDRTRADVFYDFQDLVLFASLRITNGLIRFMDVYFGFTDAQGSGDQTPYPAFTQNDPVYCADTRLTQFNLVKDRTLASVPRRLEQNSQGGGAIEIRYDLGDDFPQADVVNNNVSGQPFEGNPSGVPYTNVGSPNPILFFGGIVWDIRQVADGSTTSPDLAERITFYDGTQTTADPAIQLAEEENDLDGNVAPCFSGTSYMFFEQMSLEEFGNGLPRTEFIVDCEGSYLTGTDGTELPYGITVDTVITQILTNAGFTADQIDVTGIDNTRAKNGVYGFGVEGTTTAANKIAALMNWHDIRLKEQDGKFVFFDADNPSTGTVAASELRALEEGADNQDELLVIDVAEFNKVTDVDVQARNVFDDCQALSVTANNPIPTHINEKTVNFKNIATTQGMARNVAHRVLFDQSRSTRTLAFTLPPNRIDIVENDRLTVTTTSGETYTVRVTKVSRGANFLHDVEAVIDEGTFTYTDPTVGGEGDGGNPPPTDQNTGFEVAVFTDLPKGFKDEARATGSTENPEAYERWAKFMWGPRNRSAPNGLIRERVGFAVKETTQTEYILINQFGNPGNEGQGVSPLVRTCIGQNLVANGNQHVIDEEAFIDVYTYKAIFNDFNATPSDPPLASCTDEQLLTFGLESDGGNTFENLESNLMLIGRELIGFKNVEELERDTEGNYTDYPKFRLTGLLRNIGSTDASRMIHPTGGGELGAFVCLKGVARLPNPFKEAYAYWQTQDIELLQNKTLDVNAFISQFPSSQPAVGELPETRMFEEGRFMMPDPPDKETFESFRVTNAIATNGLAATGGKRMPYPVSLNVGDLIVHFESNTADSSPRIGCFPFGDDDGNDHVVEIMNGSNVVRTIYVHFSDNDVVGYLNYGGNVPDIDGVDVQGWDQTQYGIGDDDAGDDQFSLKGPRHNTKFLYTAAQQAADFGSTQASITIRVYARGAYDAFGNQFGQFGGFSDYLEINV